MFAIAFINDFYKRERGYYYFGNVKQVAFELSPVGCFAPDNTKVEFIKWYSTEKRALNAAKKIAKKVRLRGWISSGRMGRKNRQQKMDCYLKKKVGR